MEHFKVNLAEKEDQYVSKYKDSCHILLLHHYNYFNHFILKWVELKQHKGCCPFVRLCCVNITERLFKDIINLSIEILCRALQAKKNVFGIESE